MCLPSLKSRRNIKFSFEYLFLLLNDTAKVDGGVTQFRSLKLSNQPYALSFSKILALILLSDWGFIPKKLAN